MVDFAYYPVTYRKVERKKQGHTQREISDSEELVQKVVGVRIGSLQPITCELQNTHGNESVCILHVKGQISQ